MQTVYNRVSASPWLWDASKVVTIGDAIVNAIELSVLHTKVICCLKCRGNKLIRLTNEMSHLRWGQFAGILVDTNGLFRPGDNLMEFIDIMDEVMANAVRLSDFWIWHGLVVLMNIVDHQIPKRILNILWLGGEACVVLVPGSGGACKLLGSPNQLPFCRSAKLDIHLMSVLDEGVQSCGTYSHVFTYGGRDRWKVWRFRSENLLGNVDGCLTDFLGRELYL